MISYRKKIIFLSAALIVLAAVFTGCGHKSSFNESWDSQGSAAAPDSEYNYDGYTGSQKSSLGNTGRSSDETDPDVMLIAVNKIIRSAKIDLAVTDYASATSSVEALTKEYNGFIQNSTTQGQSRDGADAEQDIPRTATYVLRIPEQNFDAFLVKMDQMETVVNKNVTGEDVSDKYYDTESRVTMYRLEEERILEIMKSATTVSELLQLEDRLTQIRQNIEGLTGTLKKYDAAIAFSTVEVSITQTTSYTESSTALSSHISSVFKDSFHVLLSVLKVILIVIAATAPFLIVFGGATGVTLLIIKYMKRRKATGKSRKTE